MVPLLVVFLGLSLHHVQARTHDQCTSILVGKNGSANGAPMTTHTNDCSNCDFRLLKVPAMDHPAGAMVDIPLVKMDYPRYVGSARGPAYEASTVNDSRLSNLTVILGQIPQVRHTYAYLDGLYGIMNEHQVSIGESTCGGRLVSKPRGIDGGQALFDISALSRLALERCTTAREAVTLMGDLAVTYGYYGAVYNAQSLEENLGESGEALTVTDPTEAWMFHIHPDDSGSSAVWAAQRVPMGHITAVANQFVIRKVNLTDSENFIASANLFQVAERAGFITRNDDSTLVDFTHAFALRRTHGYHYYCTRRVWRVFQLANPTLRLSPETSDVLGSNYPFSVAPEERLSSADIMNMQRDHYEGTAFDMTTGPAAGPFGDPDRYDISSQGNVSTSQMKRRGGRFERAISIFRASYSFVTECHPASSSLARVWFGPYAPHATVYLPVYAAVKETPVQLALGSLFRYDASSAFWTHAFVGNWVARYYTHAIGSVKVVQSRLEQKMITDQVKVEAQVQVLMQKNRSIGPFLTQMSAGYAHDVHVHVQDLGHALITKYHDGYHMEGLNSSAIQPQSFFYPIWWLEEVGFFPKNEHSDSNHFLLKSLAMVVVGVMVLWMGIFIGRRLERDSFSYKSIH